MLESAQTYRLVNESGCITIPDVDDAEDFAAVKSAMGFLKMSDAQMDACFRLVSAALWLGNVQFQGTHENNVEGSAITNPEVVQKGAQLLGLKVDDLGASLVQKELTIQKTVTVVPLKPHEAADARDSLVKSIYSHCFVWLVSHINASIKTGDSKNFFGVLDIFGFENFQVCPFVLTSTAE